MFFSRTLKCGTCQAAIQSSEASRYSAEEMQQLARAGFGDVVPMLQHEQPNSRRSAFLKFAESYRTKWAICPSCEKLAEKYRPAKPKVAPVASDPAVSTSRLARWMFRLRNPRATFSAIVKSDLFLRVCGIVVFLTAMAMWNAGSAPYEPLRWWWQSRSAIALAEERAKSNDWVAVRAILRRAIIEDPENPRLLQRAANVELILGRPDLAAFHLQALAFNPAVELSQRKRAHASAKQIAEGLRAQAKQIVEEVYRINGMLPQHMRGTAPFHPLEAISVPPAVEPLYIGLIHKREDLDQTQASCFGLDRNCAWGFERVPWKDILIGRKIRVKHPYPPDGSQCCELTLDDPDLANPANALQRIGKLQVTLRLREMFRLASKLSFVANMIAFNERPPPNL